jgi:hypothetical protein
MFGVVTLKIQDTSGAEVVVVKVPSMVDVVVVVGDLMGTIDWDRRWKKEMKEIGRSTSAMFA